MLSGWMRDGTNPAFVIGGADGLSDEVKERADKLVSLSRAHAAARAGARACSPSSSIAPGRSSRAIPIIANDPRRAARRGRDRLPARASTAWPELRRAVRRRARRATTRCARVRYPSLSARHARRATSATPRAEAPRRCRARSSSPSRSRAWSPRAGRPRDPRVAALVLCGCFARNPVGVRREPRRDAALAHEAGPARRAARSPRSPRESRSTGAWSDGLVKALRSMRDEVVAERLRLIAARGRARRARARCASRWCCCSSTRDLVIARARAGRARGGLSQCRHRAHPRPPFRARDRSPRECARGDPRAAAHPLPDARASAAP